MSTSEDTRNPMLRVLALGDFRLLFTGASLSLLGDQFALIATPWLVLQLTGDPVVLGTVLALTGLPRAAFMLIGGAITDRLSPRRIMLLANIVRMILTGLMSFAVFTGTIEIWMVYVFGFSVGLLAGFSVPAEHSIVPMLVDKNDLQAGNSLVMGVEQIAGFVGPSLAGIVIGAYAHSLAGIGIAYGVDAVSFFASSLCLFLIRGSRVIENEDAPENILASIRLAFVHVWQDRVLRMVFLVLAAINFLLIGPLLVGIPLLASTRLPEGPVAFGILMSAFSAGSLTGYVLAGALPRPNGRWIRVFLIGLELGFGLVVGALGLVNLTAVDFGMLLLLGLGDGYLSILLFTWMQNRTPKNMLGRVMSFFLFANSGLVPLSQALAGLLGKWDLTAMLVIAGSLSILVTIWAMTRPELGELCDSLAGGEPVGEGQAPAHPA